MSDRTPPEVHARGPGRTRPLADLRTTGILWLINRVVFHPRGFALALDMDEDSGEVFGWTLLGNGDQTWVMDEEMDDRHFAEVEALLEANRQ